MNRIAFVISFLIITFTSIAQSNYDAKEAFNPQFYPYTGNDFRSASGEPGPKYWQNRADYKINSTLDTERHTVSATVELTYTNNSPDNLKFLWLQLDQNIYQHDSRASATTTEAGGRWANARFTKGDVIKSVSAEYNGKKYPAKYIISDTRMQVWLQDALKSSGGKIPTPIFPAAFPTSPSPSAATRRSARQCILCSCSMPSRRAWTWASSMPASFRSIRTFPRRCGKALRMCCSTAARMRPNGC